MAYTFTENGEVVPIFANEMEQNVIFGRQSWRRDFLQKKNFELRSLQIVCICIIYFNFSKILR